MDEFKIWLDDVLENFWKIWEKHFSKIFDSPKYLIRALNKERGGHHPFIHNINLEFHMKPEIRNLLYTNRRPLNLPGKFHELFIQNETEVVAHSCLFFYNLLNFQVVEYMTRLKPLEEIQDHIEFLEKYSILWSVFCAVVSIIGNTIFNRIWVKETQERDKMMTLALSPFTFAMKTWKDMFFRTFDNRVIRAITFLVEHERQGDTKINTRLLKNEIVQSYKVLDVIQKQNDWLNDLKSLEFESFSIRSLLYEKYVPSPNDWYELLEYHFVFVCTGIDRGIGNSPEESDESILSEFLILPEVSNIEKFLTRRERANLATREYRRRQKEKQKKKKKDLKNYVNSNQILTNYMKEISCTVEDMKKNLD